jgi:hypothetical protein
MTPGSDAPTLRGGCPCADDSEEYREEMFEMFVSLVYLDGMDMDGNERLIDDEDDDEEEEEDNDDDEVGLYKLNPNPV